MLIAVSAMSACGDDGEPGGEPFTQVSLGDPRHPDQWEVTDAKVTTRDDIAYWIVSYDARWVGDGEPEDEKCIFQVKNQEGVVVRQTGEVIEAGDDIEAEIIYPDEVPGQPKTVSVDCE